MLTFLILFLIWVNVSNFDLTRDQSFNWFLLMVCQIGRNGSPTQLAYCQPTWSGRDKAGVGQFSYLPGDGEVWELSTYFTGLHPSPPPVDGRTPVKTLPFLVLVTWPVKTITKIGPEILFKLFLNLFSKSAGIFTASIPGVYSVFLRTFTNTQHSKLRVKKNPASGSGEEDVCSVVVHDDSGAGDSCGMYVELDVGDQLYTKGDSESGDASAPNDTRKFVSFLIHLLYAANSLT